MVELHSTELDATPVFDPEEAVEQSINELVVALQAGAQIHVAQATLTLAANMIRACDAIAEDVELPRTPDQERWPRIELSWTPYARARLEKYIEAHPDSEQAIRSTQFFSKYYKVRRTLGRLGFAAAEEGY